MRLCIRLLLTLCACFTLLMLVALLIGESQPPSPALTALRLNDCELPCWLDMVPGVTPMGDVGERLSRIGAIGAVRPTGSVSATGRMVGSYALRTHRNRTFISVAFFENRVSQIVIVQPGLRVGDIILALGVPSCLSADHRNLFYNFTGGGVIFGIDSHRSLRYTTEVGHMILQDLQPEADCTRRWQGIAPAWRYSFP